MSERPDLYRERDRSRPLMQRAVEAGDQVMPGTIDPRDPHPRSLLSVLDTEMSYVALGAGDPIVFLHGNPTSSYLWRNVIPHVSSLGRCLAPDLIGTGRSGPAPSRNYRFADHARYLDAWFDGLELDRKVILFEGTARRLRF